jgi:glycerate dehydrogenase
MNLVVLDGYALNPGDLSWDTLEKIVNVKVYDRTPSDLVVERSQGAELILTNKTPLSAASMSQLPSLRYIGVMATGYNIVDIQAAKERRIPVTNIPTYGTASVAQFAFALLLEMCHNVRLHSDAVRSGAWSRSADWCFWLSPLKELAGKVMGIVGFGRIGRQVARIADAFGMEILAFDSFHGEPPLLNHFSWVSLEELLAKADVVTLHCPLFPDTEGMINTERLRLMKPTAFLINSSRGPLVKDQDLADALNAGVIAGAALDVLSIEPPQEGNPLLSAKNCLITPHIAWATREARSRLMDVAVSNVAAFLQGKSQNVVNQ